MVFVILLEWIALLVPLGCFLAASVAEIRSDEKGRYFFLRMSELGAGVIALCAITRTGQYDVLSWRMVAFSLLLGGVSLISKYSSRGARFCAVFGSAPLAFLWYFKGAYHVEQFAFAEFILLILLASAVYGIFRYVVL
jgi:hypothetical protein